ncbi:MAG: iron-sulfur cluster assembly protein [Actinomycetota bacterium]|nr:iron-sulfur cluster assembly protein [Actinomycetota bacterium]
MGALVLTLTTTAQTVIRDLTVPPQGSDGGGLRIAPTETGDLQVALAATPIPGDEVINEEGARVFLEAQTALVLADQILDAQVAEDGARFFISPKLPEETEESVV